MGGATRQADKEPRAGADISRQLATVDGFKWFGSSAQPAPRLACNGSGGLISIHTSGRTQTP